MLKVASWLPIRRDEGACCCCKAGVGWWMAGVWAGVGNGVAGSSFYIRAA